jgi:hypothetical protein
MPARSRSVKKPRLPPHLKSLQHAVQEALDTFRTEFGHEFTGEASIDDIQTLDIDIDEDGMPIVRMGFEHDLSLYTWGDGEWAVETARKMILGDREVLKETWDTIVDFNEDNKRNEGWREKQ